MKPAVFDVAVVGVGTMGSAACLDLALSGKSVLGLEAASAVPHTLGSHHGHSRIFRLASFESPKLVKLGRIAFDMWKALEEKAYTKLLYETGSLEMSTRGGTIFASSVKSCIENGLEHEVLDAKEIVQRWPAFGPLGADVRGCFQPQGGILDAEKCISVMVELAIKAGAFIEFGQRVTGWKHGQRQAKGRSDATVYELDIEGGGKFAARKLVICAGSYVQALLPRTLCSELAVVERQVLTWFKPKEEVCPELLTVSKMPVFIFQDNERAVYGFPNFKNAGVKVAQYGHLSEVAESPNVLDREVNEQDRNVTRRVIRSCLANTVSETILSESVCAFTNSPDSLYIVDKLPTDPGIVVACSFSGSGFKYAPAIGKLISALVSDRAIDPTDRTTQSLLAVAKELFSLRRFI